MNLWLPRHDFRVRSLRKLGYDFSMTPFGECVVLASDSHLLALQFADNHAKALEALRAKWPKAMLHPSPEVGKLIPKAFENPGEISLLAVGTPFQLTIWEFLLSIPSSCTMTYGEVAHAIGRPQAARAVGQAVGANEIAIVIPCHRVVSRGKLTGYRWGLERKKQILARELSSRTLLD